MQVCLTTKIPTILPIFRQVSIMGGGGGVGIDKMREHASAARRHLLNFFRHILKY